MRASRIAAIVLLLAAAGNAAAYELPSINLGFTSFLDGGPPAGPGFYFTEYLQVYTADTFTDDDGKGGRLFPGGDPDLTAIVSLNQFIYQSDQPLLLGGKWGLDLIVPVVDLDLDFDGPALISANDTGLGDLLVGPYLQWGPVMGAAGPRFMHRIELQMILPTGKYDPDHTLNPGSNFFSFNPYWSGTLFITPHLTASTRIHYLWNAKNEDPGREVPPGSPFFGADEVQAGQALHLNAAMDYEILPKRLRAGVNFYYLAQVTDTEVDGEKIDDTRERVLGVGPGALLHLTPDMHLFLNSYFESAAENRPEGSRFLLRFVYHF
jgi:anthranilate 1,2-dioxygenase (deaminating, decarboxylating) large subunit